jgi:RNA polymerase sigma-70 factor (ECF subfamily)
VADELQSLSDEDLARQSQAGSLTAFEELVYRYEHRIYGFVFQWCRNGADAREVTQDTFVKAFQAIAQFDGRHAFASWLFTIARRKCIDHHRAALPLMEEAMPELVDATNPAESLSQLEDRQNLWLVARQQLPTLQFQVLWLRYVEEMAVAEIAQALRKTQTHIKVLLFRARRTLAHEFTLHPLHEGSAFGSEKADLWRVISPESVSGATAVRSAVQSSEFPQRTAIQGSRFTFHAYEILVHKA